METVGDHREQIFFIFFSFLPLPDRIAEDLRAGDESASLGCQLCACNGGSVTSTRDDSTPLGFCCRWSCVCVRGCARDQGSFWLGTGGKATQQALQQIPGLLLVTRQRCKELDDDENGNSVADFNELTRGLIATSQ